MFLTNLQVYEVTGTAVAKSLSGSLEQVLKSKRGEHYAE